MRTSTIVMLVVMAATQAYAGIITFTDRTAFLAALSGPTFENNFQTISTNAFGSPAAFSGNGFGYQISATNGLIGIDIGADRSIAAITATVPLIVTAFSGGVTAVGGYFFFDANTTLSLTGAGTVTANNGVDPAAVLNVTAPSSLTGFFGFISTSGPLTSVALLKTSGGGFPDVDDLIVGQAAGVPEPGSLGLLATGLAALVWSVRRRRA